MLSQLVLPSFGIWHALALPLLQAVSAPYLRCSAAQHLDGTNLCHSFDAICLPTVPTCSVDVEERRKADATSRVAKDRRSLAIYGHNYRSRASFCNFATHEAALVQATTVDSDRSPMDFYCLSPSRPVCTGASTLPSGSQRRMSF